MVFFGLDESGRGPVLGPMVVALVGLTAASRSVLELSGVKDSKFYGSGLSAHQKRLKLCDIIYSQAAFIGVKVISTEEIDQYTSCGKLNELERLYASLLLKEAHLQQGDTVLADGENLFSPLRKEFLCLNAINRADAIDVSVSAASVIAKTVRDIAFLEIVQRYQPEFPFFTYAGSGYMNRPTGLFIKAYKEKYGDYPKEIRRSWNLRFLDTIC